jgi:hypothetical protein
MTCETWASERDLLGGSDAVADGELQWAAELRLELLD